MSGVGLQAVNGPSFLLGDYGQTKTDEHFLGAMGILGIFGYGFGFLGAPSFMLFAMYAYHAGKPGDRNASYYRGRAVFYCAILFVCGLSQLLLGAYTLSRFGNDLTGGPAVVSFYVVAYPAIAVVVGLVQILNAVWGVARSFGWFVSANDNYHSFQLSMAFAWLLQTVLQAVVQLAPLPAAFAAVASPIAAFAFGLNLMPAFLDYKARSVPESAEAIMIQYGIIRSDPKSLDVVNSETNQAASTNEESPALTV